MKRHLQCAEQQSTPSDLTKYCACHAKWISWLIRITYETSFTMRRATVHTLRPHQILRLPRKMTIQHLTEITWEQLKRHLQCATDPSMIRAWSENGPRMIRPRERKPQPAAPQRLLLTLARRADSIENYNVSRSGYHSKIHQMLRLPRKVTHELHQMLRLPRQLRPELHQMLRLPRKMNLMIDPHHIWNVIYNAQSNSPHPPTSPNTAPATQNDHPTSNRNYLRTAETSFTMRDRSEHDPSMIREWSENDPRMIRPRERKPQPAAPQRLLLTLAQEQILLKITTFPAPAIIPKFTKCCACHEKYHMNFTKCCACHEN